MDHLETLLQKIQEPDEQAWEEALEGLVHYVDDARALRAIISLLERSEVAYQAHVVLVDAAQQHRQAVIDALIEALQRSDTPSLWEYGISALRKIQAREAVPLFLQALSREECRLSALFALEELRDVSAFEGLKRFVWSTKDDIGGLETALRAIRLLRRPEAYRFLAEVMRRHENFRVRINAAKQLRYGRDLQVVEALGEALLQDRVLQVRKEAALSLGHNRHPQAAERLLGALPRIQHGSGPEELYDYTTPISWEKARPILVASIADGLQRTGHPKAAPALRHALQTEASPRAIYGIVSAPGKLKDREALPLIIELCGHADARVRREAATALSRIGGDDTVALLLQTLQQDPNVSVRTNAALGLAFLGVTEAAPLIREALAQERINQDKGVEALAELGFRSRRIDIFVEGLQRRPRDAANIVLKLLEQLRKEKRSLSQEQHKMVALCFHHPQVQSYGYFQDRIFGLLDNQLLEREV